MARSAKKTNYRRQPRRKTFCYFKANGITEIDYKDIDLLQRFIVESGKITPARLSGTGHRYQRKLSLNIKRARFLALLPYSDNHKG